MLWFETVVNTNVFVSVFLRKIRLSIQKEETGTLIMTTNFEKVFPFKAPDTSKGCRIRKKQKQGG